ncbi:MAG: ribonuclease HI family protein [Patescibacteria group bacterium]
MKSSVIIYTDGGARGNPGPSGAGAVVYKGKKKVADVSEYLGHRTNNWAEYEALILALEAAREALGKSVRGVEVRMDSELIVRQMQGVYKVKNPDLKEKHARVRELIAESFPGITFSHVRREQNTEADKLANDAMDRGS